MTDWRDAIEKRQALQQAQYDRETALKRRAEEREQRRAARAAAAANTQSWEAWVDTRIAAAVAREREITRGVIIELVKNERADIAAALKSLQLEMFTKTDSKLDTLTRLIDALVTKAKQGEPFKFACEKEGEELPNFLPPGRRDN
jgi:hypothetical protein